MEPNVPPPPRPGPEPGERASQPPQMDDLRWKIGPPREDGPEYEALVEDVVEAGAASGASADAGPAEVPKAPSEADILMYGQKVHVHGELAKKEVHTPQHAPKNINYARVAREEIHDVAEHPPPVKLVGGNTGVEEWDKVNSPKHRAGDFKEVLVPGQHKAEP